jgi:hypothetical protein
LVGGDLQIKQGGDLLEKGTPVYNLRDLEKKLNIRIRTLRAYIKRGDLKARKIGKSYYVTEPNLMVFLEPRS